jgi:hypothetical protein
VTNHVTVHDGDPDEGPQHIVVRVGDQLVALPIDELPGPDEHVRGLYDGGRISLKLTHHVGTHWSSDHGDDDRPAA